MSNIKNKIKQALADIGTLPWEYVELGRSIEHDAIKNANGYTILGISSYMQENVDFLLLAVNNIEAIINDFESQKVIAELAIKALKEIAWADGSVLIENHLTMVGAAIQTLTEIERLSNAK